MTYSIFGVRDFGDYTSGMGDILTTTPCNSSAFVFVYES